MDKNLNNICMMKNNYFMNSVEKYYFDRSNSWNKKYNQKLQKEKLL